MDIGLLPKKNIELNKGLYITESEEIDSVIFVHDKYVKDNYWNYAYLKEPVLKLDEIENFFRERGVSSSVYILAEPSYEDVRKELIRNGYELSYSDAIMVFKGSSIKATKNIEIKKADSEISKNEYLKIYKEVFCDEGEDVYSGLGDGYLKNIQNYLDNYPQNIRYNIVAYIDGKPAGIATVLFDDEYAVIMNVAVLEEFRNMGVAKSLSADCLNKFSDKTLFLGTEEGSVNEGIYKKMGFETVAVGKCYKEKK